MKRWNGKHRSRPKRDWSWEVFAALCEERGLIPHQCTRYHWQVRGGRFIVNFYPSRGTYYVNQTVNGTSGNVIDAMEAAMGNLPRLPKGERKQNTSIKRRLWQSGHRHCWVCKRHLSYSDATVDHLVPIAKGGSNGPDNLAIACEKCNQDRGSKSAVPRGEAFRAP